MKILITGRTGRLGSSLIKNAKDDILIIPSKKELDITNNHKFIKYLKLEQPDVVINTAAFNDLPLCESSMESAFRYNCFAVKNMAKNCNKYNIQFITFSTNYVFEGKQNEYIEEDKPNPIQIYGISKLAGEYASLIYDTTTVIRTSSLYGLFGNNNFIDNIIKDSKSKDYVEVDNVQIINSTYTEDLSKAVLNLINYPTFKHNKIYHLINEGQHSWYELAKEVFDNLKIDIS